MVSANIIIEARRRAGLTQRELATRAGVSQQEIARYERGRVIPSLERLRALIGACDLELTLGLTQANAAYDQAIARALAMSPGRRLAHALRKAGETHRAAGRSQTRRGGAQQPRNPVGLLRTLEESGMKYVLIGELAEVLRGSPLLPGGGSVAIVPGPDPQQPLLDAIVAGRGGSTHGGPADGPAHGGNSPANSPANGPANSPANSPGNSPSSAREAAKRRHFDAFGAELVVVPAPEGTSGYQDLRRDATTVQIDKSLGVAVASLGDLVRIGEASGDRARTQILRRTLELATAHLSAPDRPRERSRAGAKPPQKPGHSA